METYAPPKPLTDDPHFSRQRQKMLDTLTDDMIDGPILDIVRSVNRMPCCFTLQCCYGHFVYEEQSEPHNLAPLPPEGIAGDVEYRIAYIALGIENSPRGKVLLERLQAIPAIDPEYIQFLSADWFWKRQVNSYALQVEPDRFKRFDTARIGFAEAVRIEKTRNLFFQRLEETVRAESEKNPQKQM